MTTLTPVLSEHTEWRVSAPGDAFRAWFEKHQIAELVNRQTARSA